MPHDPRKLLQDVISAAAAVEVFCDGRAFQSYEADAMLRSACERQFEIIGEAMTRLRDLHAEVFAQISGGRSIIAFRNRLIHGYDTVDPEIVWDVIQTKIPTLRSAAERLLQGRT